MGSYSVYGKMFKVFLVFSHQRSILGVYNWDREGRSVKGIEYSRHYIYSIPFIFLRDTGALELNSTDQNAKC